MKYKIICEWDSNAQVWVATSDEVVGLVLEDGSLDTLIERVKKVIPELIELNGIKTQFVELLFTSEKLEKVSVYG